jgi:hypothetical protein
MDDAFSISALCMACTFITEIIKAWIPARYKTKDGIVFGKGRKRHVIPNQCVWPLVSAGIGAGLFILLSYDPLGLGGYASQAISGLTAGTAGGSAVFRIKNKAGAALGGTDASSAQAVGPTIEQGASPENEV